MVFKYFALRLSLHIIGLLISITVFAFLVLEQEFFAMPTIVFLFILYQVYLLLTYVNKTNSDLTRFLDAIKHVDFSQRFQMQNQGSGFAELGDRLSEVMGKFADSRSEQELLLRHLKALVEHVPVPLITLSDTSKVVLCNNSARRLFDAQPINNTRDLERFGEKFAATLTALKPGQREVVNFEYEGLERLLAVQTTQVLQSGRQEKLISLQDIQSEVDNTQIKAWQDLVRVLTHEIMNSITPISSLAGTALALTDNARKEVLERAPNCEDALELLDDAANAVNTVARRSDGLMKFVASYRKLTRLPSAEKQSVVLSDFLRPLIALTKADWQNKGIQLTYRVHPASLSVRFDPGMVEQLMLNLLKNAEQAILSEPALIKKCVSIGASLNKRGHVEMNVEDSGPGVPSHITKQVFVPFFTTKQNGSGVGLTLTRQVMIAHGGSVTLSDSQMGGAKFTLVF